MALPPFDGAVHLTAAAALPAVTVGAPGASGTVSGVAVVLALASDGPLTLVATTVTVYVTPLVRPVTVQLSVRVVQVAVWSPSVAVAV